MEEITSNNVVMAFLVCIAAAASTLIGGLSIFTSKKSNTRLLSFGLAFAGGAMVYISLVEIFWKSFSDFSKIYSENEAYNYATLAFFGGVFLVALVDKLIPNPHNPLEDEKSEEGDKAHIKRVGLMAALAITAHNIPEGMATFFATLEDPNVGMSLAFAIAVHNIPEGISIAVPVYCATGDKKYTFTACLISAVAEPIGAALGYIVLAPFLSPAIFATVFGVIAGIMVFLAMDELLPTAKRYSKGHDTVYGMVSGMAVIALSLILFR